MTFWDDVSARARGLRSHLLGPEAWEALKRAAAAGRLAGALAGTPYEPHLPAGRAPAGRLEQAVRQRVAADLALLARWAGPARTEILSVAFLALDRRAVRLLARGAAAGVPSELRLRGAPATPTLTEARLQEAAQAPTLAALARRLQGWEHPLAPAVVAEAGRLQPDLFRLETALTRLWAERAVEGAGSGDREVRRFVREAVDVENVGALLARVRSPAGSAETPFLDGGRWLTPDVFREALAAGSREGAESSLRAALEDTFLAGVLREGAAGPVEAALLERRLGALTSRIRERPSGATTVLAFVLRLRHEALALRRLVWAEALGAPESGVRRAVERRSDGSGAGLPAGVGGGRL